MKGILAVALVAVLAACAGRQVEVRAAEPQPTDVALHVTNVGTQPMNIYVVSGGDELLVGQVQANSTAHLPVAGVAAGTTVTLRTRPVGSERVITRENVVLSGTYAWTVP